MRQQSEVQRLNLLQIYFGFYQIRNLTLSTPSQFQHGKELAFIYRYMLGGIEKLQYWNTK